MLPFIYPDAQIRLSPLAQRIIQQDAADNRAWSERYANQNIPNASLLDSNSNGTRKNYLTAYSAMR